MRRVLCVVSIALTAFVGVQSDGGPLSAAPAGFDDVVVASGFGSLTTVEALPDGRVIVLGQSGGLIRLDDRGPGAVEVRTLADFNVCADSERGLLGFALDPAYVTSGFVYLYRTVFSGEPGGCHNRVSRFFMDDNGVDLGSERILVDRISSLGGNHNGGDLEVGNDGFLYIAVGDAGADPRADSGGGGNNDAGQDLSLLNGKILRVDRSTGAAAPGNPFTGAGTADCRIRGNTPQTPRTTCREIFSFGLRNPYRFAFDPNTSATRFYINDVGQRTREEVNLGAIGANYGWPFREGRCPQGQNPPCAGPSGGLVDPITDYSRGAGLFITGGAFVPNGVWPAQYDGSYLVSDGAFGTTWAHRGETDLNSAEVFLSASAPTDMAFVTGPDGPALWYVQQNGQVHKVAHDTPRARADSGPLRYDPLPSIERRFDSRALTPRAPLRAGQTRLVDIGAPAGAEAALVNITMARPQAAGAFVTAWQPRTLRPSTATANADLGDVVANASIVPVDADGRVLVFVQATTDVIIDVSGFFFGAPDPIRRGRFETVANSRIIDSRQPAASDNDFQRVIDGDGERLTVPIAGAAPGVPASGDDMSAVVLVITGVQSDGPSAGFVTAYPSGAARVVASNANVNPGTDVRANLAVVPVPTSGSIELYLERVRDVTVDVVGYFTDFSASLDSPGRFHLIAPAREVDTRRGLGFDSFGARDVRSVDLVGVPASATAVAQNLTMVRTGGRGFVTAGVFDDRVPDVSSVNAAGPGLTRGALNIAGLDGGRDGFYSQEPTDLTVDVFGWFE